MQQPPQPPSSQPPSGPLHPSSQPVIRPPLPLAPPSPTAPTWQGMPRFVGAPQKPSLWQRFRRLSQGWQLGIALSTAAVLLICGCCSCGTFASALNGGNATAQSTSTATVATGGGNVAQATTAQQVTTATTVATATPKPKPTATPKPKATSTPKPSCIPSAVSCNPWGYTFTNTGKLIYNPPGGFCGYFDCISSFWNGSGYVMECQDGMYSKSGGRTGSCSRHGGDKRPLYAP